MQRQVEVIKSALSELGCEEVPSGCDLSIDSSFVDNHTSTGTTNTEQQQVSWLTNSMEQIPPPVITELIKKFSTFCGT
jgi:hypothetical protein